jgi:hypothetical protein
MHDDCAKKCFGKVVVRVRRRISKMDSFFPLR